MGYGKRALKQLKHYYEGKFTSLDETETPVEANGKCGKWLCLQLFYFLTFSIILRN
jgi:hypothetical protein